MTEKDDDAMNLTPFRKRELPQEIQLLSAVAEGLAEPLRLPVDLDEAQRERELGMAEPPSDNYATPIPVPLPSYVQHNADATPTGAACGEAIVREYEQAAQEMEALGDELRAAQARAEERQRVLVDALSNLTETARAYREEAKRVFEQVEACTTMANSVSDLCSQLRSKIKDAESSD